MLKESLDNALLAMLGQVAAPSIKDSSLADKTVNCSVCHTSLNSSNLYYKTPCCHSICRNCVLNIVEKNVICHSCQRTYLKSEIVRAHH